MITHCDDTNSLEFDADWVSNAIPYENSKPMKCHQYEARIQNQSIAHSSESLYSFCDKDAFNNMSIVRCDSHSLVYRTDEISIANAVYRY